jgi:hypothetical protein
MPGVKIHLGVTMFKKFAFFLAALFLAANLLTACQPSDVTNGVSPTDLMTLLNKKATAITKKPGWLHVTETVVYDVDKENLGVLPNETVIPLEYKMETWYHINPQGKVYEYVQIQSTMDGDIVQVSVFVNQVIVNVITNYALQMPPYALGQLDYRFSNEMADFMSRTGKNPKLKIATRDGHNAAIFTLEETLSEPITTDNYNDQVYGTRTIAYYDTENGLLFRLERIRIFKNGPERTFYRTDITVEQNATPPDDILDYLKGIN